VHEPRPDVIRAAAAGETGAFEELVRLYEADVWRFLRRMIVDPRVAEDVAQETFIRVYRHLGTFSFESKFSTWLFRVARNAAVDALRREGRRSRLLRALPPPEAGPPPDQRVEIEHAIAALAPRLRESLLAVEVLGLTYREAGDVLGVPEGTVKSRTFHARATLAAWLSAGENADEM